MQHKMRRTDRQLSEQEAFEILNEAEYGVLSTVSEDGAPYGVPLNFSLISGDIYFHSAEEGHKVENLKKNPKVSFCVVAEADVLAEEFDIRYGSVIAFGTCSKVLEEKRMALESLLQKYSPDFYSKGLDYIEKNIDRTRVFKISVDGITGKANR